MIRLYAYGMIHLCYDSFMIRVYVMIRLYAYVMIHLCYMFMLLLGYSYVTIRL
jgi:hypothetical protein